MQISYTNCYLDKNKGELSRAMKNLKQILALFLFPILAAGQGASSNIKGILIDKETKLPVQDAQLFLIQLKQLQSTDSNGRFWMNELPQGNHTIHILYNNEVCDSFRIAANNPEIDLGVIPVSIYNALKENAASEQATLPTIALDADHSNLEDEGITSGQNISNLLSSSGNRDPFLNAVSFVFSQYNFRPRGYNRANQQVYINGILMNDLSSGNAIWAQWGGLNDVMRNQTTTYGLAANQQAFGGINGSSNIEVGATEQAKQNKLAYSISNRSYNNRIMLSHGSGLSKKGWAYTVSGSRRWAVEGYVPGTSFDGYSGFLSLGKVLNSRQQISLSIIAAQSSRARSGAATDEVYALANDTYYNANWGWQNGEKRNARIGKVFEPIAILQLVSTPNDKTQFYNAISFQRGRNQSSTLDWQNASDPRPDYYRNLPSYFQNTNPFAANSIAENINNHPDLLQLDWDRFYNTNKGNIETLRDLNGNANDSFRGARSLYVIGTDVEQMSKISIAGNIQHKSSDKLTLSGGYQFIHQRSAFFKELQDLLGGDYFINYNMFAAQQYPGNSGLQQNDLNIPDRAVLKGEKYRYHYTNTINKTWVWGQAEVNTRKVSLYAAVSGGYTAYQRNGLYANGLFSENSFGKSKPVSFFTYNAKAGLTYKINGRNYFVINSACFTEDAGINNIFVAPKTRNQIIENPELAVTKSVEAGYLMRAPRLNIRVIGYATDVTNATSIQRFYNDEPEYQSFVNFVMRKVNTRYIGTELAAEYIINPLVSINAVASIGQAFYTNRPEIFVYNDNDTNQNPGSKKVYIRDYYLGVGPQSAYTAGITYNGKKFWYMKLNGNYLDRNYVSVNPSRRSLEAAELITKDDPLYAKIFDQERLPAAFTMDVSGGKSIRLNKISKKIGYGTTLYLNIGISNILNERDIKSNGFEQLRYDFTNNNPDKFPTKYIYGYGRTFFANLSLKF